MSTAEELLTDSWKTLYSTAIDLLKGTERLVEVGLIDEEHRDPIKDIQKKAAINYNLCQEYQNKTKDMSKTTHHRR